MPRDFLCPNTDNTIPLRIGSGPSDAGSRLGGKAPVGIVPREVEMRYVCTVPLSRHPNLELSIFLSSTFEDVLRNYDRVLKNGKEIEAIEHLPSRRGNSV